MAVFNLIVRIVFFASLGWSVCVLIYFFIRRGIERRKAKKDALKEDLDDGSENSVQTSDEKDSK